MCRVIMSHNASGDTCTHVYVCTCAQHRNVQMIQHTSHSYFVQLHYDSYYSRHYLMYSESLQVYNCLVVMKFRLLMGFVGLQRGWSGRFLRCLSLVLRCYDISLGIQ